MKALLLLLIWMPTAAFAEGRYDALVRLSDDHSAKIHQEGINYALGGVIGLGLSVALGVRTKEALPKLGYSLIQVLSAASVAHGASLYYQGDGLTQEGDRLKVFAKELENQKLSPAQRAKILDSVTEELMRKEVARYKELRKIRGYLELTSAAASGVTLGFSKSKSSASSSALGFIILIGLVGAYSDLIAADDPKSMLELYSLQISPLPGKMEVAYSWRW